MVLNNIYGYKKTLNNYLLRDKPKFLTMKKLSTVVELQFKYIVYLYLKYASFDIQAIFIDGSYI